MGSFLDDAKVIIGYLAHGVEFAAALVIGLAALEATIKSLGDFCSTKQPSLSKERGSAHVGTLASSGPRI